MVHKASLAIESLETVASATCHAAGELGAGEAVDGTVGEPGVAEVASFGNNAREVESLPGRLGVSL